MVLKARNELVNPAGTDDADEAVLFQRSAKADQFNVGTVRNHHRAEGEGEDLCPVRALQALFRANPERCSSEREEHLFRWKDGSPVTRDDVRKGLAQAARALGLPEGKIGVHSLRTGGASAIHAATKGNGDLVKRFGRWASEAYQGYIWETDHLTEGLASGMSTAKWNVHSATLVGLDAKGVGVAGM